MHRFEDAISCDDELDELDKIIYQRCLNNCDCFGASQAKCFVCDDVYGNSFKRFNDANTYVSEATMNCKFDYTKSAWYHELKRIINEERHLLLKGESDMIAKWLKGGE